MRFTLRCRHAVILQMLSLRHLLDAAILLLRYFDILHTPLSPPVSLDTPGSAADKIHVLAAMHSLMPPAAIDVCRRAFSLPIC